jgi:hypothetical protein
VDSDWEIFTLGDSEMFVPASSGQVATVMLSKGENDEHFASLSAGSALQQKRRREQKVGNIKK